VETAGPTVCATATWPLPGTRAVTVAKTKGSSAGSTSLTVRTVLNLRTRACFYAVAPLLSPPRSPSQSDVAFRPYTRPLIMVSDRNESLRTWLTEQYIGGNDFGLGNPDVVRRAHNINSSSLTRASCTCSTARHNITVCSKCALQYFEYVPPVLPTHACEPVSVCGWHIALTCTATSVCALRRPPCEGWILPRR
jgi:hypothetical protein